MGVDGQQDPQDVKGQDSQQKNLFQAHGKTKASATGRQDGLYWICIMKSSLCRKLHTCSGNRAIM